MCYKEKILKLINEREKTIKDIIIETIEKERIPPLRQDRAVNVMLTDIAALTAASMIIREGLSEDESIQITEEGRNFLMHISMRKASCA